MIDNLTWFFGLYGVAIAFFTTLLDGCQTNGAFDSKKASIRMAWMLYGIALLIISK